MHVISEIDWCVLHSMSINDLVENRRKFDRLYPIQITINVPKKRYYAELDSIEEAFGEEDDEVFPGFNGQARWSRYHPLTSDHFSEDGIYTSSIFGFKTTDDAMLFKMRWYS